MDGRPTTGEEFVDHRYIEEADVSDRYLLGKLPPEEQERFEEHFVDCAECLDRLETTRRFRRALKIAVAEEAARSRAYVRVGLLAALIGRNRRQRAARLVFTLLVAAALATAFFVTTYRRAREESEQAKKATSERERRYEEQQQASSRLEKERQEANVNLTEQGRRLEPREAPEPQSRPGGKRGVARRTPPQIPVPVFALSIVRSADPGSSEPANRVAIPRSARSFVLSLELENDTGVRSYRATIAAVERERVVWKRSNLKPHSRETLRIKLPSGLVAAGDYRLTLEGLTPEGNYLPAGTYDFRASEAKRQ